MHWENFRTKIEANSLTYHSGNKHSFKPIRIQSDIMQPVLGAGKYISEQITVCFALISDWSICYAIRRWTEWQISARCSFRTNFNKKAIKWYAVENKLRLMANGRREVLVRNFYISCEIVALNSRFLFRCTGLKKIWTITVLLWWRHLPTGWLK